MSVKVVVKKKRMTRTYTVSAEAIAQAKLIGICGEVEKWLLRMARRSAPVTHADGNRRFDAFVLMIQDGVVMGIDRL